MPDRFSLVRLEGNSIVSFASRELIQPFTLDWFADNGAAQNGYSDIIKDLHDRAGGGRGEAALSVSSDLAIIKRIPIPLGLTEELITSQIAWETEQCLVSGRNEFVIDYQKLPFITPEGNPQYLLVLIRRTVIRQLRSLFRHCGIAVKDIDLDAFSLVRLILYLYTINENDLNVIVDIRRGFVNLIFVFKNEYYLSQKIPLRHSDTHALIGDDDEIAQLILKELKRIIFGHRLGSDITAVKTLYFSGSEDLHYIVDEIAGGTAVSCEIIDPTARFTSTGELPADHSPSIYSAAVGMALKYKSVF
ncbi:pilus assembly protein PilM [bacterium]|nr:pilus assembly protein PilM [bacterium]